MLEREVSLKTLREAVSSATRGAGSIVVVAGEAGIGKTLLIRTFAAECSGSARVLIGICDDLHTPPAFGPWRDIARTTGGELSKSLAAEPEPGAVLRAIVDEASSGPLPNLIIIEDIQWADDATLDSLRYLSRRIEELPTVVVITHRTDELSAGHPLVGLLGKLHGSGIHRIDLDPLTESAVADLAAGTDVDPVELHRATGGNPFFVREVLAAGDGGGVPPTVRDAVLARLQPLSSEARDVITLAAVSPGGVEQHVVAELSGAKIGAISEAEDHGILEGVGDRIRFHNELARRAIEEALTSAQRRDANQRLLGVLREIEADGARLLHHAVAAGDVDTVVAQAPEEARRCAASGAHRQAASWYDIVMSHEEKLEPAQRAQILYDYAVELHRLNRLEEAIEVAGAAVAAWEGQQDATGLGRAIIELARNQHFLGEWEAAYASTSRAIAVLEEGGKDEALASAYSSLAALHVWRHGMSEALPWGEKARRLAASIDRPDILSHSLNYLGVAKVLSGDESGFEDLTEAVAIADRIGHAEFHARAANNLATALFSRLRYREGVATLEVAVERAADAELLSLEYNMRGLLGQGLMILGSWDDAEAQLRPLVERAGDDLLAAPSFGYLGRLLMRRGLDEGDKLIDRGLAVPGVKESLLRYGAIAAAAVERAWLAGDPKTIEQRRGEVVKLASAANALDWVGTVTLYAARSGLDVTAPDPCPPAFLHGIEGDWERAAAAWEEVGDPYERAIELVQGAHEEHGLAGLHILDNLGATRTALWARNHLAAAGISPIPPPPG